jgi:hypothetical protein
VDDVLDALEARLHDLRRQARQAAGEQRSAVLKDLLRDIGKAEASWASLLGDSSRPRVDLRVETSLREQVLQALHLIGVPASQRLIRAVLAAFYGVRCASVTSLRRDEARSYRSTGGTRAAYVVPALRADTLTPARGLLARSDWDLTDRLVGPDTPRVHHLRTVFNLTSAAERHQAAREDIEPLLDELAATVRGRATAADLPALRAAAEAELRSLLPHDAKTRSSAARRAERLPADQQLFGATPPRH